MFSFIIGKVMKVPAKYEKAFQEVVANNEEFLAKMREFESSTNLDTTKEDISMWFWGRFYEEAETNKAFIEYCSL